jgi:hypothetical protein
MVVRTPTRAEGGITDVERVALDALVKLWISRAMRTDPIEPVKIVSAIEGIYAAAGLKKPTKLVHLRDYDTHLPIGLDPGMYVFRTGREFDPFESVIRASAD